MQQLMRQPLLLDTSDSTSVTTLIFLSLGVRNPCIDCRIIGQFLCASHIATQKESVGMYSRYDKLSPQILFVYFLALPSLFRLSILFNTCYCSFFIALRVIHVCLSTSLMPSPF
jgi:hypothetical protein